MREHPAVAGRLNLKNFVRLNVVIHDQFFA